MDVVSFVHTVCPDLCVRMLCPVLNSLVRGELIDFPFTHLGFDKLYDTSAEARHIEFQGMVANHLCVKALLIECGQHRCETVYRLLVKEDAGATVNDGG